MGSIEGRVSRLEGGSRDRALREVVEHIFRHTDEEIATLFVNPQSPPAWADRERQAALLEAAGAHEEERMTEVVMAILDSLETRKRTIRRHMEEMGHTWRA